MTSLAVDEVQMLGLGMQVQVTHWQGRPSWAAGCFQVGRPGFCVRDRVAEREEPIPRAAFSLPRDSLGFTGDLESLTSPCIWKWGCWGSTPNKFWRACLHTLRFILKTCPHFINGEE